MKAGVKLNWFHRRRNAPSHIFFIWVSVRRAIAAVQNERKMEGPQQFYQETLFFLLNRQYQWITCYNIYKTDTVWREVSKDM